MNKLASFFTELMRKYLPDPFVFAIALTLLTVLLAMGIEGQSIGDVTRARNANGLDTITAIRSGSRNASCFGTSSPRIRLA